MRSRSLLFFSLPSFSAFLAGQPYVRPFRLRALNTRLLSPRKMYPQIAHPSARPQLFHLGKLLPRGLKNHSRAVSRKFFYERVLHAGRSQIQVAPTKLYVREGRPFYLCRGLPYIDRFHMVSYTQVIFYSASPSPSFRFRAHCRCPFVYLRRFRLICTCRLSIARTSLFLSACNVREARSSVDYIHWPMAMRGESAGWPHSTLSPR
jgi:hypothetical protein